MISDSLIRSETITRNLRSNVLIHQGIREVNIGIQEIDIGIREDDIGIREDDIDV